MILFIGDSSQNGVTVNEGSDYMPGNYVSLVVISPCQPIYLVNKYVIEIRTCCC